jgi:hypothetical protein
MEKIKVIFASVLFTLYFITFARLHIKFKLNIRPFNCELCLPVYAATILLFCPEIVSDWAIVIFFSGISSCLLARLIYNSKL